MPFGAHHYFSEAPNDGVQHGIAQSQGYQSLSSAASGGTHLTDDSNPLQWSGSGRAADTKPAGRPDDARLHALTWAPHFMGPQHGGLLPPPAALPPLAAVPATQMPSGYPPHAAQPFRPPNYCVGEKMSQATPFATCQGAQPLPELMAHGMRAAPQQPMPPPRVPSHAQHASGPLPPTAYMQSSQHGQHFMRPAAPPPVPAVHAVRIESRSCALTAVPHDSATRELRTEDTPPGCEGGMAAHAVSKGGKVGASTAPKSKMPPGISLLGFDAVLMPHCGQPMPSTHLGHDGSRGFSLDLSGLRASEDTDPTHMCAALDGLLACAAQDRCVRLAVLRVYHAVTSLTAEACSVCIQCT